MSTTDKSEISRQASAVSVEFRTCPLLFSQRVGVRTAGQFYYLHTDPLGSISVTTNGSQVVKGTLNYLPFGATRVSTGDVKTDYAFTGQRLETTDGLLYYGAREYDATIGRFIQPDSIIPNLFNPQDLNRYSYVRNNPVRYTDPTGHMLTDDSSGGAVWAVYEPPADQPQDTGGGGDAPANTGGDPQPSGDDYCQRVNCSGSDPSTQAGNTGKPVPGMAAPEEPDCGGSIVPDSGCGGGVKPPGGGFSGFVEALLEGFGKLWRKLRGDAEPSRVVSSGLPSLPRGNLPPEAQTTITTIEKGGPFPFSQDGTSFINREGLLPQQPVGYYREYTVQTPGLSSRGAQRIVAGENGELYYTDDHYSSFMEVR